MNILKLWGVGLAIASTLALPGLSAAETPTKFWLDQENPTNWNRPGDAVPRATKMRPIDERCAGTLRQPNSPEDQAVVRAGWRLAGARQTFNGTTLVTGVTGADGMCRPIGYQTFVFVNGRFAGTISPVPMDSRTEGAAGPVMLYRESSLNVNFSRYTDADALCCPSRNSFVSYKIEEQRGLPVLVPQTVYTQPSVHAAASETPTTLAGTSWQLISLNGKRPLPPMDDMGNVTLNFVDERVFGSASCNNFTGAYQQTDQKLSFGTLATTLRACPDPIMRQERAVLQAFENAKSYQVDAQGNLQINYEMNGQEGMLVFAPKPIALEGTNWKLVSLNGQRPLPPVGNASPPTIKFENGQVGGSGSCNRYFGPYKLDGQNLEIGTLGATRMACPPPIMGQESLFLTAVQGATSYEITAQGELRIQYTTDAGAGTLVFVQDQ